MEEKMAKESHNYSVQRNYKFESHDADGNFLGITEDEWKEKIRESILPVWRYRKKARIWQDAA